MAFHLDIVQYLRSQAAPELAWSQLSWANWAFVLTVSQFVAEILATPSKQPVFIYFFENKNFQTCNDNNARAVHLSIDLASVAHCELRRRFTDRLEQNWLIKANFPANTASACNWYSKMRGHKWRIDRNPETRYNSMEPWLPLQQIDSRNLIKNNWSLKSSADSTLSRGFWNQRLQRPKLSTRKFRPC